MDPAQEALQIAATTQNSTIQFLTLACIVLALTLVATTSVLWLRLLKERKYHITREEELVDKLMQFSSKGIEVISAGNTLFNRVEHGLERVNDTMGKQVSATNALTETVKRCKI